jgi:hypothetical protein
MIDEPTGLTATASSSDLEKIEGSAVLIYKKDIDDPIEIWEDGIFLKERASVDDVGLAGSWYWDGTTCYIHTTDSENLNTNGKVYEVGNEPYTIFDNSKAYVDISNIDSCRSYGSAQTGLGMGGIYITGSFNKIHDLKSYQHRRHCFSYYVNARECKAYNLDLHDCVDTTTVAIFKCSNCILRDSVIYNEQENCQTGVIVIHGPATGIDVIGNDIFTKNSATGREFVYVYDSGSKDILIKHNRFSGQQNWAIRLTNADNVSIEGNVINGQSLLRETIFVQNSPNVTVYSNTIKSNPEANGYSVRFITSANCEFKNNIVDATQLLRIDTASNSLLSDYNDLYSSGTPMYRIDNTVYNSLSDWQTASSQDSNSIDSNPLFMGDDFYWLKENSPARNIGVDLGKEYKEKLYSMTTFPKPLTEYSSKTVDMGAYSSWIPTTDVSNIEYDDLINKPDLNVYAKLDGTNQPFTGNLNISKADPELKLTNGNSAITTLIKEDTGNRMYLRNYITAGVDTVTGQIPSMTSNTAPSGVASASSYSTYDAFYGFQDGTYPWQTSGAMPQWIKYQFPAPKTIGSYSIKAPYSNVNYTFTAWTFEGSNDDTNWTTLDTQTGQSFTYPPATTKTYTFTNSTAYLYYRLTITAKTGGLYIQLSRLQMFNAPAVGTVPAILIDSQVSAVDGEVGIHTFGPSDGRHVIEGLTTRLNVAGVEKGKITSTGLSLIDSFPIVLGTGDDATIQYNGTNLIINPKAVGSGAVHIQGNLGVNMIPVGAFSIKGQASGSSTVFAQYNFTSNNTIFTVAQDSSENSLLRLRIANGTTKIQLYSAGISYLDGGNLAHGQTTSSESLTVNGNLFLANDNNKIYLGADKDEYLEYDPTLDGIQTAGKFKAASVDTVASYTGGHMVGGVATGGYVDRGDNATNDFILTDLTTDGTWRDLDLSSIVPAGAKAVYLVINVQDDAASSVLSLRKNGITNDRNKGIIRTQVANIVIDMSMIVSCDSNRVIEYIATNTTWSLIQINVRGWFI